MSVDLHRDLITLEKPSTLKPDRPSETQELSMDQALLKRLHEIVESNLRNEQFSVEDLASEAALSRSHLHRKLRSLTGQSISQFIRKIRLDHAIEFLKKEVGTVSEIAFRVGFGSSTYFIKCFSDEFGFSPGEVKKRNEEGFFDHKPKEEESTTIHQPSPDKQKQPALEILHPSSSEGMIREIFDTMILHKPTMEKFVLVDEDEGETVDIRLLAYQIFKNYPWPIGVEIRRLFSVGLKDSTSARYHQLQKTILRIVRLLAFIAVSELIKTIQERRHKMDQTASNSIPELLSTLSPKNLISIIQSAHAVFQENKKEYFVQELKETFDESFFRELEDWIVLTQSTEEKGNLEEECASLEQIVTTLLKKASFLVKYKLVNVSSIKVIKSKFKPAFFQHDLQLLNSADSEFQLHQQIIEQFSDSHAVLLMKSIKEPTEFLNLSPLVIDTHGEEINSKSKTNIKKDIFLMDSYDGENINYLGTEVTSPADLSSLDHYQDLVEEYREMCKLMSQ